MPVTEADVQHFLDHDYARMVRSVGFACGSDPLAEDAVAEALARVWDRSQRGHAVSSLPGLVRTTALNLARSRLRRFAAERRAVARLRATGGLGIVTRPADDAGPIGRSLDPSIQRAIASLPRRQREIVALHYLEDLSVADIAAALDIGEGTVKTHLHRARAALRASLAAASAGESPNSTATLRTRPMPITPRGVVR